MVHSRKNKKTPQRHSPEWVSVPFRAQVDTGEEDGALWKSYACSGRGEHSQDAMNDATRRKVCEKRKVLSTRTRGNRSKQLELKIQYTVPSE
ncbi:hypothetical protein E2C01_079862 [Portunus trituberculatus]|uniref:Uncharacterized protein n=1 Tax=Portunus trituberculatus TaxID=210409 RepID=A0A5B7IRX4_PORTR|nr:hypothetical protein [Portunus trituberculatus]